MFFSFYYLFIGVFKFLLYLSCPLILKILRSIVKSGCRDGASEIVRVSVGYLDVNNQDVLFGYPQMKIQPGLLIQFPKKGLAFLLPGVHVCVCVLFKEC